MPLADGVRLELPDAVRVGVGEALRVKLRLSVAVSVSEEETDNGMVGVGPAVTLMPGDIVSARVKLSDAMPVRLLVSTWDGERVDVRMVALDEALADVVTDCEEVRVKVALDEKLAVRLVRYRVALIETSCDNV